MPDEDLFEESGISEEESSVPDETESEDFQEQEDSSEELDSSEVSGNDIDYEKIAEIIQNTISGNEVSEVVESTEDYEICTDIDEFESSTIAVDLYQYTILKNMEFMKYAFAIIIALLFLILFMRYKK